MKTEDVRKAIIGILSHSPEGEPFIIDEILEAYAKEQQRYAYPDTEAGGVVFCGKCGKML